jgi:hypothetical protein
LAVVAGCGDTAQVADVDASPDAPRAPLSFTTVATIPNGLFDRARTPTGIAAFDGKLFVGLTNTNESEVVAVDSAGTQVTYATGITTYETSILGLAANAAGDIYIAVPYLFLSEFPQHSSVYRIPAGGAPPELVADLGNGRLRAIDVDGDKLYVTDLFGRIDEIDAAGNTSIWADTLLLRADNTACGDPRPACDAICAYDAGGAQGITHDANNRYVAEPDHGRVIRFPINADGTAGTPVVFASSCSKLSGIVGIAVESPGVLIGVVTRPHSAIVEIRGDGQATDNALHVGDIETLHAGDPLGLPFGIARDVVGNRWTITDWAGPNDQGRVLAFTVP